MAPQNTMPILVDRRIAQKMTEVKNLVASIHWPLAGLSRGAVLELLVLVFEHVMVWLRDGDLESKLSKSDTQNLITSFKPVFSGKVGRPRTKGEDEFSGENAVMPETPAELRILVESEVRKAFNRFQEMLPKDVQTRVIRKDEQPSIADMDPGGHLRKENNQRVQEWKAYYKERFRRKHGRDGMDPEDGKYLQALGDAGVKSIKQHGYLPSDYEPPPKLGEAPAPVEDEFV